MLSPISAFSGFSVKNLTETHTFYTQMLGLEADLNDMGIQLHLPGGAVVFLYQKENHVPATYTVLNFVVTNIDEAVDKMTSQGIRFEHYNIPEMPQDEKGVARGLTAGRGPDIAWFTDPSGNILAVLQEAER